MELGKLYKLKDSGLLVRLHGLSLNVVVIYDEVHHFLEVTYKLPGEMGFVPRRPFEVVYPLSEKEKINAVVRAIFSCTPKPEDEPRGQLVSSESP